MATSKAARGGVWAQFFSSEPGALIDVPLGGRVARYRVDAVEAKTGLPVRGLSPAAGLVRVEAPGPLPAPSAAFLATGVAQHVLYTDAETRKSLAAISAGERGPRAVLIPIAKSEAWWALAQDERERHFRRAADRPGHVAIGTRYAPSIFRRLYQSRFQPGSEWDFLTYFELAAEDEGAFRQMLAELRDPALNPEWTFVERECEIWLTKE
jgi:hypothetical protein